MAGLNLTLFLYFLSLSLIISGVSSRVLSPIPLNNSILISDGIRDVSDNKFLTLDAPNNFSKAACLHVYGFLPCADNTGGYAFQVFSFGCLLILGDYFLSEGRSKLFLIFEVGIYGGIIFPLLTMFPRIALMITTGLSLSSNFADSFIGDNVGVTVGYTVFSLTVQWGACFVFSITGPSLDHSVRRTNSTDEVIQREMRLKGFVEASVVADTNNKKASGIMLLSLAPFLMVTFSAIVDSPSWSRFIVLFTLIISVVSTVVYFIYSYRDRTNQEKSLDHARFEHMSEVREHLERYSPNSLIKDGILSKESLKSLFEITDTNKDGKIQISELRDLTIKFWNFGRIKCDINELLETSPKVFDGDNDVELNEEEFEKKITELIENYNFNVDSIDDQGENQIKEVGVLKLEFPKLTLAEKMLSMRTLVAAIQVITGILIVLFLAKPFMANIELLSVSAGIPSFYIIFAMIPLARNLKNTLSTRFCRSKDKKRISSITFSGIYEDVTMNNLMGMSIVLAIVYTRGLTWNHSIEALIVVIVGLIMGLPIYMRSIYPFWMCLLALFIYVMSLLFVYLRFQFPDKN